MLNQSGTKKMVDGTPSKSTFLLLMFLAIVAAIILLYFGGLFAPIDAKVRRPGVVLPLSEFTKSPIASHSYRNATIGSTFVARRAGT